MVEPEPNSGPKSGTSDRDAASESGEATVLIVDDEPEVLESLALYLSAESYEVLTAQNGAEALVELEPGVDVVLLDRRMPGMSGDELLEHIDRWHGDCRVVMETAVDPDPAIVDFAFDDYLTKPVGKDELLATLEQLLLFDRYEDLLVAYNAATRKYATLKASLDRDEFESSERVATLERRRDELRADLEATIEQFGDEEVSDIFRQAHSTIS